MKSLGYAFVLAASLWLIGVTDVRANSDMRKWTLASGEFLNAELVKYDLDKEIAVLRMNDEHVEYQREAFSSLDQAWLIEWAEVSQELDGLLNEMPGRFEHYQTTSDYRTDFYVYFPSKYDETSNLPMLILLHPAGKGARHVKRFMEAGEMLGVIIVSTDGNRNTGRNPEVAQYMFERFVDLLESIEAEISFDHDRLFIGGMSGGALRAYIYTARIDRPWAGVLANGGWLGGDDNLTLPYPSGMRVAMVNGNNDRAANQYIERDSEALKNRGCEVGLFSFEGGHQIPPPLIQIKAMEWMMRLTDKVYHSPVIPLEE